MKNTQQANNANTCTCPKCGGIHFGDIAGNCPLSPDYIPSKPWPKAADVLAKRVFCEKHNRFYQEGTNCFDCLMDAIDDEILEKQLIIHEFVPACNGCACHWVAEFGGNLSGYEKWVKHFVKSFRPSREQNEYR